MDRRELLQERAGVGLEVLGELFVGAEAALVGAGLRLLQRGDGVDGPLDRARVGVAERGDQGLEGVATIVEAGVDAALKLRARAAADGGDAGLLAGLGPG